MEEKERVEKGSGGGWSKCSGTRAAQRRPLVCPKLGPWRSGWETFEGQGGCPRPWMQKGLLGSRLDGEGTQEEDKVGEMRPVCGAQERKLARGGSAHGGW